MITILRARLGRRLARLLGADDEKGMALATVIIFGMVLLLMSATVVSVSVSGNGKAQSDEDWIAAGQAAYAGVEDYQSKLANDNSYSQYGAKGYAFSASSTFDNGTNGNLAFGVGTGPGAVTAAGSPNTWQLVNPNDATTNPKGPAYRYQVDNSKYSSSGILRLQSTGRVGKVTRTVVANLKQSGFLDYLYFTDLEFTDPALDTDCPANSTYQWSATLSSNCSVIQFASGDSISGSVHSNDTLSICGSTFKSAVTTSAPVSKVSKGYVIPSGCSLTPSFAKGNPTYTPVIQMPSTITQLSQETRSDLTASTVPRPGCLYTGPTTFTFNADGTWTVYSPWTQFTNFTGSPASKGNNANAAQCGTPGFSSKGGTLGSPGGQTFTVLANNVAFVQGVPTNSTDPNYPSSSWSGGLPPSYTCTGADNTTAGNGVGFPANGETAPSSTAYGCKSGDAFVRGTVNGNVTIGAANYAYVTGDVVYNDPTSDLLGIIGQNNVYVYNPVKTVKSGNTTSLQLMDRSKPNRVIDAAIMSVAHSFTVENYSADSGYPDGKLTVLGSIVQKYRGPVATSAGNGVVGSGFTKDYQYDPRLAYLAPPKFLSPVSTTYGITSITETKTAMNSTGVGP
jgi:hypothetical protein